MVPTQLKSILRGLAGTAVVAVGGCIISSPADGPGSAANVGGTSGPFGALANSSGSSVEPLSQLGAQGSSTGQQIASSLRGMTNSVSSALTIEPRTIQAADPLRLGSDVPAAPDLHVRAARVYESQDNFAQALSHYESALLATPNDPQILLAVARLYDRHGEWLPAETFYLRASDADPQNAGIFNDLALCYARQQKYEEAVTTLAFAVQQDPENQRYRNNIAAVLIEAGRIDEAYQQLVSVHSEAVARYNTGYLLSKKGHVAPAAEQLRLAVQADPSLSAAQQLLESLSGATGTPAVLTSDRPAGGAEGQLPLMRRLPPV